MSTTKIVVTIAAGALAAAAAAGVTARPLTASAVQSEFQHELQAAQAGPTEAAGDVEQTEDFNVDTGEVENIDNAAADTAEHKGGDAAVHEADSKDATPDHSPDAPEQGG